MCTSMEDRKHVCVGCEWIQPKVIKSRPMIYSHRSSSPCISTLFASPFCLGMTSAVIVNVFSLALSSPASTPHVSMPRCVLYCKSESTSPFVIVTQTNKWCCRSKSNAAAGACNPKRCASAEWEKRAQ